MALTNVQGGSASGDADFGNPVKVGAVANNNTPTAVSNGARVDLSANQLGALSVTAPVFAGSAGADGQQIQGFAGRDQSTNATSPRPTAMGAYLFNGTGWDRQAKASAVARLPSAAATTNATVGKASAGTVYTVEAMNTTASVKYLKLYNKATAPTVGTDTPFRTLALAPSNARSLVHFPNGLYLNAGISFALTGAAADADTTALAAGDVVGVNIDYS